MRHCTPAWVTSESLSQKKKKFFLFLNVFVVVVFVAVFVLRLDLTLSLRIECTGMILAHYSLNLLGSSDLSTSACQVVGTTNIKHHVWIIFGYLQR